MTEQHPITPPPWELVEKWMAEIWHEGTPVQISASDVHIATRAAQWGADQELEACCKELEYNFMPDSSSLRAARRHRPPSLKQQALDQLREVNAMLQFQTTGGETSAIRRALEALDD